MGEKSEESLRDFWDSIRWTCMPVGRVPDGEGKEKEQRVYLKRWGPQTPPNWGRVWIIQEVQQIPSRSSPERSAQTWDDQTVESQSQKGSLESSQRRRPMRGLWGSSADSSADALPPVRHRDDVFKVLEEQTNNSIVWQNRPSETKEKLRYSHNKRKKKVGEFVTIKPALQEMSKGVQVGTKRC